jgi:hypothetical protein
LLSDNATITTKAGDNKPKFILLESYKYSTAYIFRFKFDLKVENTGETLYNCFSLPMSGSPD